MANSAIDVQLNELKDMIQQLNKTNKTLADTIEAQSKIIASKDNLIAELTEEIKLLRKKFFGSSKEKMPEVDPDQLSMFKDFGLEPETAPELPEEEYVDVPSYKRSRKKKPTLEEQFQNIPKKIVTVDTLSEEDKTCPVCGTAMKVIGKELIHREVVHIKPQLYMIEYYGNTYACPVCKDTEDPQFVKDTGAPASLIEGSYVSESLAAYVFYEKFGMAIPFYRLEKSFEELGAKISRTSMAAWAIQCNKDYFSHLTEYFHRKLLEREFLMMDETPIQVLKEPGKRAESKSYVWLIRSGDDGLNPIVYYKYSPTRSGETAKDITDGVAPGTYLMCDGYTGYNKLKDIKRCTCYAHIRRYFFEAIPKGHERDITDPAVQGVMYCNKLFDYERKYKEQHLKPETRYKHRLKYEKPVIEAFLAWAEKQYICGNGKFSKAVTYLLNRRDYLMTYLEDGRCSLCNNWSEQSIRPITVGRKNWLFSNSVDGAEASMSIYTIIEMAKLYNLSRYKYLEFILKRRPNENMTDDELDKLSPWNDDVQAICRKGEKDVE